MILRNISFSAMPGAIIQFHGINGSGKTSLLRCIAQLHQNYLGDITYNSCLVNDFINEYKQIILYISDKEQLHKDFTVYETLNFWGDLYESHMLLPAAAHTLNLVNYLEFKIHNLSKGLKRRVILSRLLLQRARIWLLDEPFTNLDVESIQLLQSIMSSHLSNGGIILFADHTKFNFESIHNPIAELQNIGYKIDTSSQLEKQTFLKLQDFQCSSDES